MTFTIKIFVAAVLMANILAAQGSPAPSEAKQAEHIETYGSKGKSASTGERWAQRFETYHSRGQESYFGEANTNSASGQFQSQGRQSQEVEGSQSILVLPSQTSQMSWSQTQYQAYQPAPAVESVEKEIQVYQKPAAVQTAILEVQQPAVENESVVVQETVLEKQRPVVEKENVVVEQSASEKEVSKKSSK